MAGWHLGGSAVHEGPPAGGAVQSAEENLVDVQYPMSGPLPYCFYLGRGFVRSALGCRNRHSEPCVEKSGWSTDTSHVIACN
jgi:hypothetical protein